MSQVDSGNRKSRRRLQFGLGALFVGITLVAVYFAGWQTRDKTKRSDQSEQERERLEELALIQNLLDEASGVKRKEDTIVKEITDSDLANHCYFKREVRLPAWIGKKTGKIDRKVFTRVVAVQFNLEGVDAAFFERLEEFSALECLESSGATYEENGPKYDRILAPLAKLKNVKNLCLDYAPVGDRTLEYVGQMENLVCLSLHGANVTDAGVAHLARLKKLQRLSLESTKVTGHGLRHLANLPQLHVLMLNQAKSLKDGFESIATLTQLERLDITACKLDSKDLVHISELTKLRWLRIGSVTDAGLWPLRTLTHLTHVSISGGPGLTGTGLYNLQNLHELEFLCVTDARALKDESIDYLGRLRRLETLNLGDTSISDAAIPNLLQLPKKVHSLFLFGTQISEDGLERLRSERPNITVNPNGIQMSEPFFEPCYCPR